MHRVRIQVGQPFGKEISATANAISHPGKAPLTLAGAQRHGIYINYPHVLAIDGGTRPHHGPLSSLGERLSRDSDKVKGDTVF